MEDDGQRGGQRELGTRQRVRRTIASARAAFPSPRHSFAPRSRSATPGRSRRRPGSPRVLASRAARVGGRWAFGRDPGQEGQSHQSTPSGEAKAIAGSAGQPLSSHEPSALCDGATIGLPAAIRSSTQTLRLVSVTAPPAGETPVACRGRGRAALPATRRSAAVAPGRTPPGRDLRQWARLRDLNLVADHSSAPPNRRCWPIVPRVTSFATAGAPAHPRREDAQSAGVETRSCAGPAEPSQLVRVVRDDHERRVRPVLGVRRVEQEVDLGRVPPEHLRKHPLPRPRASRRGRHRDCTTRA